MPRCTSGPPVATSSSAAATSASTAIRSAESSSRSGRYDALRKALPPCLPSRCSEVLLQVAAADHVERVQGAGRRWSRRSRRTAAPPPDPGRRGAGGRGPSWRDSSPSLRETAGALDLLVVLQLESGTAGSSRWRARRSRRWRPPSTRRRGIPSAPACGRCSCRRWRGGHRPSPRRRRTSGPAPSSPLRGSRGRCRSRHPPGGAEPQSDEQRSEAGLEAGGLEGQDRAGAELVPAAAHSPPFWT